MSDVSRAVLYAIEEAALSLSSPALIIGDYSRALISEFKDAQFWNPDEDVMPEGEFKSVIIFTPKQKDEMRYWIAIALQKMKSGGVLVLAAANDAGGKILAKNLTGFGVKLTDISKHKCRVVWTNEPQRAAKIMIDEALQKGGPQRRDDGLWTQAGLFSWDHVDVGTNALLHHLPFSLSGDGADFGCGIGVIGIKLLDRYKDIKKLFCLDRDIRALQACDKNLSRWPEKFEIRRADLTLPVDLANLDFIIMNPPFHAGKKQAASIGQAFIVNAAKCLKTGGVLVFVANSHLPYEATVTENFSFHRVLNEEHGFKIIEAVR